jgi:hypothetical protein
VEGNDFLEVFTAALPEWSREAVSLCLEVLCGDPKRIFGFFWCFDLLTLGYALIHEPWSLP